MYRLLNCFIYSSLVVVATEVVKEASPPKLPDLERYWKPVQEDSTNFTGWTYLLQYVDQEVILMQLQSPYREIDFQLRLLLWLPDRCRGCP